MLACTRRAKRERTPTLRCGGRRQLWALHQHTIPAIVEHYQSNKDGQHDDELELLRCHRGCRTHASRRISTRDVDAAICQAHVKVTSFNFEYFRRKIKMETIPRRLRGGAAVAVDLISACASRLAISEFSMQRQVITRVAAPIARAATGVQRRSFVGGMTHKKNLVRRGVGWPRHALVMRARASVRLCPVA